jgi:hypothetical protein
MSWRGGIRRRLASHSARSRSPRHGPVSEEGQESEQLQVAHAPDPGGGPASSSSGGSSSSSAQPPLRDVLAEYFLTNTISAQQLHTLASSSAASGAQGVQDLVAAGAHGTAPQNMARDLLRTCVRGSPWPTPYFADVPVMDKATRQETMASIPFLLPHEMLEVIAQANPEKIKVFVAANIQEPELKAISTEWATMFHKDMNKITPVGLHGDGVPFAAKMRDSLEQLSWSLAADPTAPRILFTALPKSTMLGRKTWDAVLQVVAWSMQQLALGSWPTSRHTGEAWASTDKARAKKGGQELTHHAALLQCRADWAFYNAVFDFPNWSSKNICWKCRASRGGACDYKETGSDAAWRAQRLEGHAFLAEQMAAGITPSAIFSAPGFQVKHCMVDYLHTMDLGVAADCLGNLFLEILHLLPGTRAEKVANLWGRMKRWYGDHRPHSQLQALTWEMIKNDSTSPAKLRAKAAECRALIPFGAALAREFDNGDPHRRTVAHLMGHLQEISVLVTSVPYQAERAAQTCKRFALLYTALEKAALEQEDEVSWRSKPKLHLLQQLLEYTALEAGSPSRYWTYIDESWGGWLATTGGRRGGANNPSQVSLNLIQRFRAFIAEEL